LYSITVVNCAYVCYVYLLTYLLIPVCERPRDELTNIRSLFWR